jgi:hypothetical protein
MTFTYADYKGPGRDHAVIDGKAVPFDARASRRLAENAALLSLGAPEIAATIETPQQRHERELASAA